MFMNPKFILDSFWMTAKQLSHPHLTHKGRCMVRHFVIRTCSIWYDLLHHQHDEYCWNVYYLVICALRLRLRLRDIWVTVGNICVPVFLKNLVVVVHNWWSELMECDKQCLSHSHTAASCHILNLFSQKKRKIGRKEISSQQPFRALVTATCGQWLCRSHEHQFAGDPKITFGGRVQFYR